MKFPLPPDTMPKLQLPLHDQQCIERLASVFVNETVDQYMEHLQAARAQRRPRVCKKRWKQIKKRGNMTVYQDRNADESVRQKMSFRTLLETPGELAKTHVVMGLGHCEGLMEDAVYGSIAPTEELMMVKTAYASDGVVDCRVLSSIITPTPMDPLRALQIKWCVNGSAPMIVSSMVRKRDFVYVESSGIVMTQSGERISFNFLHSLEFEGVPDLSHLGLVRANLSICSLFRQREEGGVELFLQGFCDPLGDMAASVAILTSAEAILSYAGVVRCGQMKKLNWALSKSAAVVYAQAPEVCCVCHKNQSSSLLPKKHCRICKGRVCHSCRKPQELCFVELHSRTVRRYKLSFCMVRWLYQFDTDFERDDTATMKAAVANGDVELVRWLHQTIHIPVCGVPGAAASGHLTMLRFLHSGLAFDRIPAGVLVKAAENGHLDVVRWVIEFDWDKEEDEEDSEEEDSYTSMYFGRRNKPSRPPYVTSVGGEAGLAIHAAAINGHLEVAKYINARVDWPMDFEEEKLESKHLSHTRAEIAKELGEDYQAAPISRKTMLIAARRGFLEVVEWLCFEFSCNYYIDLFRPSLKDGTMLHAMDEAAANGHLAVVKYLHQVAPSLEIEFARERKKNTAETMTEMMFGTAPRRHGIECTTEAMDAAAEHNHLEVVKWLHENRAEGCTSGAMDCAARSGHIEMVQWLHAHRTEGCTKNAMAAAAGFGHLDVVKWLHEHTTIGCTTLAMDAAAAMGHLNVVKWLHDNRSEGCTNDAMDFAAESGHLNVVKWLHEHRSEGCTEAAMDLAAESGKLDVVKFLHRHRGEGCTQDAMIGAAAGDHVRVMEWLHANRPGDCSAAAIDNAALHGAFEATMFLHLVRNERMSEEVTSNSKVRDYPGFYDFIFEKVWGHE